MVEASVTLYTDIGIYPDYKRTMLFDTKTQQKNWFDAIASNKKKTVTANYNKLQNSFVLHEDVGNVYQYTYVRIKDLDNSGRYYYGFVANVTLVDEENTRFDIALDPIQTFMCEWSLGESLVMREHCDRWENNTDVPTRITPNEEPVVAYTEAQQKGTDLLSNYYALNIIALTANNSYYDENLDKVIPEGKSSRVVFLAFPFRTDGDSEEQQYLRVRFTSDSSYQAIKMPLLRDIADGSIISRLGINADAVIGSWVIPSHNIPIYSNSTKLINTIDEYVDAISIMNQYCIFSLKSVDNTNYPYSNNQVELVYSKIGLIYTEYEYALQVLNAEDIRRIFAISSSADISTKFSRPTKPTSATSGYSPDYEPALYMAPYRKRGIGVNGSSILEIPDNVFLQNNNLYLHTRMMIASTGPRQDIYIDNYDSITDSSLIESAMIGSYGMDNQIAVDVLNNEWLSYSLTSRQSDRDSVKTQILANTLTNMLGMGYGGALVGSRANSGQNDPLKGDEGDSIPIRRAGGMGKAMMSATMFGMATGLATSAVQGWDMWSQQLAKESSIKNQPSQLTVKGDGFAQVYNKSANYCGYEITVDENAMNTSANNFRYYGYIVNRIEVPNIKSRYYYNYICTLNTTIKGSLSADIKNAIAKIFEKGITFFHADHCNTTEYNNYENIERALI